MRTRKFLLHVAAGTALSLGLAPTLSAEPEPAFGEPVATPTALRAGGELQRLAEHLGIVSRDADPQAAAIQLLEWIAARTGGRSIEDRDGDGAIGPDDVRMQFIEVLRALRGDLNGDGVVDAADARRLADRIAEKRSDPARLEDGDLNGDGVLDQIDLALLLQRQGDVIDFDEIEEFAEAAAAAIPGPWDDHAKYFSDTFPPSWPGPPFWPPFPPSHEYTISAPWWLEPPFGPGQQEHARQDSQHGWPPNHYWQLSVTWPDAHMYRTSDIDWPGNHLHELSVLWPGNHASGLSVTWPPNHILPNSHKQEHLRSWSLLHPGDDKPVRQPSPHRTEISLHWADHQVARSLLVWPTNHHREASLSWGFDHAMNLSLTWPAGHFGGMSRLWPAPTPLWPPNHMVEASRRDGDPHTNPLPPLFPEDHTIFKTLKELIPLIPTPSEPSEQTPGGSASN